MVGKHEEEIPEDVFFCESCGKAFTKLGDKFRHIQSEHELPPSPELQVPGVTK